VFSKNKFRKIEINNEGKMFKIKQVERKKQEVKKQKNK